MEIQIISNYYFWYILVTLIGLGVGIASYRRSFPPLGKLKRIVLATIRAVMIALIGILLIEPLLNVRSTTTINPKLAVLVDISRSMSTKDGTVSRSAQAGELIGRQLAGIKDSYKIFEFSSGLSETGSLPEEEAMSGDATSIANALAELGRRDDFKDFGAVMLVTDGRQNLGDDPVEIGAGLGLPIYTLTVGERVDEKNLAIDNVIYPAVAYSGANFRVEAELSANGLIPGKSRLTLRQGSKAAADKAFDIPQENRKVRVAFDVKAPEPGNYEYTLSAPVFEGEANKVDNERLFAIRILRNKLKLLLISSGLDWEYKFARQMLGKFEEFEVDAVYPESGARFSEPGTPQGVDGLEKYDVILMVNSSPVDLRISTVDLKKYLGEGGSLIYLAGADAANDIRLFEGILPVKTSGARLDNGEFFFEPSPTRKQHAAIMMDEDPDASLRIWHSYPPFTSILMNIEPTGVVLLEAGVTARDSALTLKMLPRGTVRPVLTVGSSGKGHVAAITGFPWWRSFFGSVNNQRLASAMPEFWRNLVKWSAATEEMRNFRIITDRKVYRLGEPIRFTGYLYDESNRPRNGALVSLRINARDDPATIKDVVLPQVDNGIYSGDMASFPSGRYGFKAFAAAFGDTLGKTDGDFAVESFSLEMASTAPDYNLTRRLSEGTGGKTYTAENIGNFSQDLKLEPYAQESQASLRPFGMPAVLTVLVIGLCLEWALRKRFRLP
ncbi:MAG: hypothetical protein A2W25_06870 [candidate division Zixibacteria bacterium RBG_16_53_22]|nr:MAG: hypothetical protein A2W25_06870 [candidate division Zixibacteria bacterium RBG_16_53_22]